MVILLVDATVDKSCAVLKGLANMRHPLWPMMLCCNVTVPVIVAALPTNAAPVLTVIPLLAVNVPGLVTVKIAPLCMVIVWAAAPAALIIG